MDGGVSVYGMVCYGRGECGWGVSVYGRCVYGRGECGWGVYGRVSGWKGEWMKEVTRVRKRL